ncbi:reprolysin-like metallopeptidase [Hymenobacter jeollabukensis]|uniref:T9SS type A sorting domain-containing protein n=1 Tax=Hymenobacter jeollabukensis TaxID=2025313 RepID=A0A5R8WUV4_9BACT|nr:zinc-dependent metalloprotease family protein [Hymenobacter jeollabukensis]TLM95184.1 T9SS type A sorting domain-containing protein [Hymenobacter jeollabukensis]
MKHRYLSAAARPLLSGLALLLSLGGATAQQRAATTLLRDIEPTASPLAAALQSARSLALDPAAARATLATAPPETRAGAQPLVLSLPLPDGRSQRFAVWQSSVMAPALAARYPEIQTYTGRGLDDAGATLRLDLTPAGFHAQVLSPTEGTVFIEPARRGDTQQYVSFNKRDAKAGATGQGGCDFQLPAAKAASRQAAGGLSTALPAYNGAAAQVAGGGQLRTYRVAVATTGEYATFHGGTVPLTLAAIVTSINRVVGVYEKELAVRLVLVSNTDQLIYLNATTDPYTNNDGSAMLGQNQTTVDNLIGSANYDIGHVFSTGGGGVAGYAVVCKNGNKARGVTGSTSPVADAFDIDYVAHEMGHQFSGSHPFNGNAGSCGGGNRSASTAWEPGSGSSIMAYAGICGTAQNLQPNSDPYFHVGSFEEMRAFIVTTPCAVVSASNNAAPVVSIPAAKTLPISTPFKLTASAQDIDGDALTYSWEEIDRGSAGSPTAAQTANNNVPLFRSWVPTTSPTRYFPRLSNLVNNTVVVGERLPTVTRRLVFKCTARDQHSGPLGVIGGVGSSDSLKLSVTSTAGPFVVTAPTAAGLTWAGGTTQTVTWDVANTTAAPVSCATVNIRLSTDGGLTYPTFLARGVANNGTATVTAPNVATTTARLMVEAADNYFFDISNADFAISTASPCAPATALTVSGISNTGATLSFTTVSGATQYVVTTSPATTTQTVTAGPVTFSALTPGTTYTVQVVSSCGAGSSSAAATVSFTTTAPAPCLAPSELAVSNITLTSATLNFLGTPGGGSYTISTVPATTTQTVTAGPVTLTGLTAATNYVVRVTGTCTAGSTFPTTVVNFRTLSPPPANDLCANAVTLTCGGSAVTGTTEGATITGDPTATCVETVDQGGVFYRIVGTGGLITLTTCSATTNFDTKLFVFTGTCGNYTCVTGNDDASGPSCSANSVASRVSFTSTAGTSYLVMVSGWDDEVGNFALSYTCGPVAAREAAATAFQVWPNPAGAQAAFHVTLPAPAPAATATLRNVLGQQVAERRFSGTAAEVSTAGLAPGTYLLTVQVAGQAPAVRRVVVE